MIRHGDRALAKIGTRSEDDGDGYISTQVDERGREAKPVRRLERTPLPLETSRSAGQVGELIPDCNVHLCDSTVTIKKQALTGKDLMLLRNVVVGSDEEW